MLFKRQKITFCDLSNKLGLELIVTFSGFGKNDHCNLLNFQRLFQDTENEDPDVPKAKRKSGQSDWSFSQKSPAKSGTQDSTAQNVEDITITDEQTLTDQTKTPVDDQTKSIIKDQTKSIIKDQTKSIINDKTKSILKDKTKSIINVAQAQSCES